MSETPRSPTPKSVLSIYPALVVVIFALGLLVWAQTYGENARKFPSLVAIILFVLGLMDMWSRTKLPGQTIIRDFWGTSFDRREMNHSPGLGQELNILGWVLGCFAGMAVIGILAAVPLFCLAFTRLRSKRSLQTSVMVALAIFAFEFIVFEWLLDYELYRGLMFSKDGLARW